MRESWFERILMGGQAMIGPARYRYLVAIAVVVAATAIRLCFLQLLGTRATYLTFYPAVTISALYGGVRAGLVTTVLSALLADYFWIEPTGQFGIDELADWLAMGFFLVSCTMISSVTEAMHRAQARAIAAEARTDACAVETLPSTQTQPLRIHQLTEGRFEAIFPVNKAFAVALAVLVVVAWLSLRNTEEMFTFDRSESQADEVIHSLNQLLLTLKEMESDQRTFLLLGDQNSLDPYLKARAHLDQELAALKRLTDSKPQQQRRTQEIEALIQEKLFEQKQTINLRRSQDIEATLQKVRENLGRGRMDNIREQANAFHAELDRLRHEQGAAKAARRQGLIKTIVAGYFLSFSLLFLVFILLRKQIFKRLQAEASLVAQQEQLEQTVVQRTCELKLINTALAHENEERKVMAAALVRSNTRLDLIAETASQLLKSDAPQEIVEDLCRKVMDFLDCHVFFNFLVDKEAGKLRLNAYSGIPATDSKKIEWLDYGVAVCGCAARDGHRIIANNISETSDPRTELVKSYGIQAYVCHPLIIDGEVIGTLSFGTRNRIRFTGEEIAMMQTVADQVAFAQLRRQATESLRVSEERLRLVLSSSKTGSFEFDLLTGEGRWNEVEYALLGIQPGDAKAEPETFFRFVHPDDLGSLQELWGNALQTGELDCEFRIIRADGEERWLAGKGKFFYTEMAEDGIPAPQAQAVRFLGVNFDITDRKLNEEKLRDLSQRLAYHVDNSPLAVIEWGPDMRLTRWSHEAERIFGWQPEEVLGKRMDDFRWIYHEDVSQVAGISAGLVDGSTPRNFSLNRNYRKDGSVCCCEWYNSSLMDKSGEITSILSLVLDVTNRTRAEEALKESESRLHTLANAMPQLAWIAQPDGYISWYNQRWYDYTGTTPEQMTGWGWQNVHDPGILPKVLEEWRASLVTTQPFEMEFPLRGADGRFRQFLTRGFPLKDAEGKVLNWFGTNTDVSERKQAEERIQASLQEKDLLLKEIHHRVKNNLQVISSLVDLQADSIDNPALAGLFQDVRDRVRSMAMVHETLYRSDNLVSVDFADYVSGLMNYLWRAHGSSASKVKLTLDLHPVSLAVETAVPCGLLLNELAVNALKHAFAGRDRGEVVVSMQSGSDGLVRLGVRDNGVGFTKGQDWRQKRSLGLNLVRMLTKQLKGAVEMESSDGTSFFVTFPPPQGAYGHGKQVDM